MANIDKLIPFILYYEAGLSRDKLEGTNEEIFRRAAKTGFANDPDDRGGMTLCGVTYSTYCFWCGRKGLAPKLSAFHQMDFATWRAILKELYWDRWKADRIQSQPIADILVDWVWASGTIGVKWPQRLLGVKADGMVGSQTLGAVNAANPETLFSQLHEDRITFVEALVHHHPSQAKFLR